MSWFFCDGHGLVSAWMDGSSMVATGQPDLYPHASVIHAIVWIDAGHELSQFAHSLLLGVPITAS